MITIISGYRWRELLRRMNDLENTVKTQNTMLTRLKRTVKTLQCSHEKVIFTRPESPPHAIHTLFYKECQDCGKILGSYKEEKDWIIAQREYAERRFKDLIGVDLK